MSRRVLFVASGSSAISSASASSWSRLPTGGEERKGEGEEREGDGEEGVIDRLPLDDRSYDRWDECRHASKCPQGGDEILFPVHKNLFMAASLNLSYSRFSATLKLNGSDRKLRLHSLSSGLKPFLISMGVCSCGNWRILT